MIIWRNTTHYKIASIIDTGYGDETFDGVIAYAVIDQIDLLLEGCKIVSRRVNQKNEKLVVVEKQTTKGILLSGKE